MQLFIGVTLAGVGAFMIATGVMQRTREAARRRGLALLLSGASIVAAGLYTLPVEPHDEPLHPCRF